ncbi:MAG: hypothetical protein ACE5JF_07730 [Anaerolineales bacterium]
MGWPAINRFQKLRFDSYSVKDGLSQSSALSLKQESRGFLWMGTEDGLNRVDGVYVQAYRTDPYDPNSLSNNYVGAQTAALLAIAEFLALRTAARQFRAHHLLSGQSFSTKVLVSALRD